MGVSGVMDPSLLLLAISTALAFSTGGGEGVDERGNPFLQACNAISLCSPTCPPGMTAVAPPERSTVYSFGTTSGVTSYRPGQLLPFELNVTRRTIPGKRDQGRTIVANETAKYLGLLVYAVNRRERKVGAHVYVLCFPVCECEDMREELPR